LDNQSECGSDYLGCMIDNKMCQDQGYCINDRYKQFVEGFDIFDPICPVCSNFMVACTCVEEDQED